MIKIHIHMKRPIGLVGCLAISILITALSNSTVVQAQAPSIEWSKWQTSGSYSGIFPRNGGGGYIAYSSNTGGVVLLNDTLGIVKQGMSGVYPGNPAPDGGYITGATASSDTGIFAGTVFHGSTDAALIKLNDTLGIEWVKCYGGSGEEGFSSVRATSDGGYIAIGWTLSTDGDIPMPRPDTNGRMDWWVVKLNDTGGIQKTKCFGGSQANTLFYSERGWDIIQDTIHGGYFAVGQSASTDGDVVGQHGVNDIWALKLDDTLGIAWSKCYGGSNDEEMSTGHAILQPDDSSYVFMSYTKSIDGDLASRPAHSGTQDWWVLKVSATTGDTIWTNTLGGSGITEVPNAITSTPDGNIVVCGYTDSHLNDGDVHGYHGTKYWDTWVVKLDVATGDTLWTKCMGGTKGDRGFDLVSNPDGSLLVGSTSNSTDGDLTGRTGSAYTGWQVKLAPCPYFTYLNDTTCSNVPYSFNGNLLTAPGVYWDTLSMAGGCDSLVKLTLVVNNIITPVITANGAVLSTGGNYATYQWLDGSGNPISGATTANYTATANGNYRVAVTTDAGCADTSAEYNYNATGVHEPILFSGMKLYPNPVSDILNIEIPKLEDKAIIVLTSLEGKIVAEEPMTSPAYRLSVGKLPDGVYFLKIITNEGTVVRKFTKR